MALYPAGVQNVAPPLTGAENVDIDAGGAVKAQTTTAAIAALAGSSGGGLTQLVLAGSTSGTTTITPTAIASGTITFPAATDTVALLAATQTFTNKTLTSPILTTPAIGSAGATFAGSGSGTTTVAASATASGTLTLPAATDTLVGKATTDTLTNKTLTAPSITTPTITNPIITPNAPVAATGTNLSTAAQVNNGYTLVTASDGTKCVKLPATPTPGMQVTLFNAVAAQPLIIFPDAAATINAIGSHGALTCANGVPVILYATSATQWYSLPLVPS